MNSTELTRPAPSAFAEFRLVALVHSLRKCPMFANLPYETANQIAAVSIVKTLPKGDYLFHEGASVHGFYFVQAGAIKLHRVNASGKEQVIHIFGENEIVGEEALFSDSGHFADASATAPSRVVLIKKAEFARLIRQQPDLAVSFVKSIGQQFRLLLDLLGDLTTKDVQTRLAHWLIQHCPNPGSDNPYTIQLPMAKRLLASELGTVSETFSRTLAKFRDQKLVSIEGKAVTLLCPTRLAQLVNCSLGLDSFPHWNSFTNNRDGGAINRTPGQATEKSSAGNKLLEKRRAS